MREALQPLSFATLLSPTVGFPTCHKVAPAEEPESPISKRLKPACKVPGVRQGATFVSMGVWTPATMGPVAFLAANAHAPWSENLVLFWKQSFLNFEKGPHSARVDLCLAGGCCGCCNSINVCQASRTGSFTELKMASPSFWNPDSLLFVLDFALPQMLSTQPFLRFTGLKTFDEDCH